MSGSETSNQHIPIFVGSTFTDMQQYRSVAHAALHQLETIVRGMEHFGSKPGGPLDECLNAVRSCKVYIGIFGMRYGSIPENQDKSMTHLEYDEAQGLKLPSLIYIIDEENQPILPKHVEIGPGAEKLKALKELLRKRHMISHFTTPQDLRSRLLHDVPDLLKKLGNDVEDAPTITENQSENDLLAKFKRLPKLFSGRALTIEFEISGDFKPVYSADCQALGLEIGASVYDSISLTSGETFNVYAEREIAAALCNLPAGMKLKAWVVTAFGTHSHVDYGDDSTFTIIDSEEGLIIKKFTEVENNKKKKQMEA